MDLDPLRGRLLDAARARELVLESELPGILGIEISGPYFLGQVLTRVSAMSEAEVMAGRPMLTAILVDPDTMLPGKAFTRMGRRLRLFQDGEDETRFALRQIGRVHNYWGKADA